TQPHPAFCFAARRNAGRKSKASISAMGRSSRCRTEKGINIKNQSHRSALPEKKRRQDQIKQVFFQPCYRFMAVRWQSPSQKKERQISAPEKGDYKQELK
ncbi:MAG: hypothetical protein QNL48_14380, partial [Alcaligenes aquatilis]